MPKNFYFGNYEYHQEQDLLESLVTEAIAIHGQDFYFLPRTIVAKDEIFHEDAQSRYDNAYIVVMYTKSFEAYEGDGTFLSKFHLEIRDQVTLTLSRREFQNEIAMVSDRDRPLEGDLVYSPMMKRMFIIKYVNNTPTFYAQGALQTWDLVCEVFEYSNEIFNTGIDEIDSIEGKYSVNENEFNIMTNDEYPLDDNDGFNILQSQFDFDKQMQDTYADNKELEEESEGLIDWNETNPFGE